MYLELQRRLAAHLRSVLLTSYNLELDTIPLEIPPDLRFGELATPLAFELARKLRKAPKIIAQEIVAALGTFEGFAGFEVAGAGYINARLDRSAGARATAIAAVVSPSNGVHSLVEHTSINPNKAAHVGHLRNAILGDTFVRLLRAAGQKVDVQNYIDNTGVQVADIVVDLMNLPQDPWNDRRTMEVQYGRRSEKLMACLSERIQKDPNDTQARIDYYCWDHYARVQNWYEGHGITPATDPEVVAKRKQLRLDVLHQIEAGNNEVAGIAELISTAVLRRHLETMLRLDIEYDFLPRESEILHLKFWDLAFEQLKQTGVLYFETEGKNKGCWVMTRPGAEIADGALNEDAKVIVRSNNTVTYVGQRHRLSLMEVWLAGPRLWL